jgi:lysine-N-methylase
LFLTAPQPNDTADGFGRLPGGRLRHSKLFQPDYSEEFRCIGPACEDSCCEQWTVHVDRSTFENYQNLPAGPLRTIIDENVLRRPEQAQANGDSASKAFAQIRMNSLGKCPLLAADGLCRIQVEHGEELLPHACANYPRIAYSINGVTERALSLSCPEAARLVLLNRQLRIGAGQGGGQPIAGGRADEGNSYLPYFWSLRDSALTLVGNRAYPLWQRMFLLGLLSHRFDAIAPEERRERVPQLLAEFDATVASGHLEATMNTLPVDHAQQLDLVLMLAGMLLHQSYVRPRFVECVQAFTEGIGNGPGATLESLTACYAAAHDRYYAPFFQNHPYILENYLTNTIFRCRFPFGRDWAKTGATPSMTRESNLLTAQFALMKGLLIGVAGFHREQFSAGHVVHTVQTASKHFEHHTEFLTRAYALLVEKRMDGQLGLAVLLRNEKSRAPLPASGPALPVIHEPIHAPAPAEGTVVFPVRALPTN